MISRTGSAVLNSWAPGQGPRRQDRVVEDRCRLESVDRNPRVADRGQDLALKLRAGGGHDLPIREVDEHQVAEDGLVAAPKKVGQALLQSGLGLQRGRRTG